MPKQKNNKSSKLAKKSLGILDSLEETIADKRQAEESNEDIFLDDNVNTNNNDNDTVNTKANNNTNAKANKKANTKAKVNTNANVNKKDANINKNNSDNDSLNDSFKITIADKTQKEETKLKGIYLKLTTIEKVEILSKKTGQSQSYIIDEILQKALERIDVK